jgi:tetratricopeptide (TPR) repeat protein
LNERIENARTFEAKRLFGEAIKEWEAIGADYPWLQSVAGEVERLAEARRKEKSEAAERWLRQVEEAIETCDYDNAATMLRQAAQQQPDRKLQGLEAKLTEGLKKKHESDAKLDDGRTLFADGDLEGGGKALYQSFELQPKDQDKTNAIVLLFLGQIRAHMISEPAICEGLLAYLKQIRPDQVLPADIREALVKRAPIAKAKPVITVKPDEAEKPVQLKAGTDIRSAVVATSVVTAAKASGPANADKPVISDGSLGLRRSNFVQKSVEKPSKENPSQPLYPREELSFGTIAAALIVLLCLAGAVFLFTRPANRGVPVQISVTPDHTMIDLDGQVCVMPDCKFKALKPGEHHVKFRKDGYKGKDAVVTVKETDSTPLNLTAALEPLPASPPAGTPLALVPVVHGPAGGSGAQAKIQIRGALPRTRVRLDGSQIGEVTKDGTFTFAVPPGPHTVDLSLDGFSNRTITRNFVRGESVSFAKDEVQLKPRQPEVQR